jgi:aspartyl-tRNA(Asn)/glutamyl-tRNA(Gln) amidotransferase subunit A
VKIPNYNKLLTGNVKGLKIGIPKEYQEEGLNADIQKSWEQGIEWFKKAGADIIEVSLPHSKYALPTYYIIAPAEASSNLARYDGVRYGLRVPEDNLIQMYEKTRAAGFGDEVQRRILIGTYVLSAGYYDAYYIKAQKMKRLICEDFNQAFKQADLILSPTTPTSAFAIGEEPKDPVSMYMNDVLTVPANIAGLPAMSIPAGLTSTGLPLGLQLIAPPLAEAKMLNAGYFLEEAAQFAKQIIDLRSKA